MENQGEVWERSGKQMENQGQVWERSTTLQLTLKIPYFYFAWSIVQWDAVVSMEYHMG